MEQTITATEYAIIRDTIVMLGKERECAASECIDVFKEKDNNFIICRKGLMGSSTLYIVYNLKYNKNIITLNTEYLYRNKIHNTYGAIFLDKIKDEKHLLITDNNYLIKAYRFKDDATNSNISILPMLEELIVKEKVKINERKIGKKKKYGESNR